MARSDAAPASAIASTDADLSAAIAACAGSPAALRQCVLSLRRAARAALDTQLQRLLATSGQDARAAGARELSAGLDDLSVGELLQIIALGRKDAVIDVFDGALVGRVWCCAGEIIDAMSGGLTGEQAAYRVLASDRGELVADFRAVQRTRNVHASTQAVMLEAARRKDECALLESRLGGAQGAFFATASPAAVGADGVDARLLATFTGGARLAAVRANSSLDDLGLLQSIASLVERGLLVARPDARPRETPSDAPLQRTPMPDPHEQPPANVPSPRRAVAPAAPSRSAWRKALSLPGPLPHPLPHPRASGRAVAALLALAAFALSLAGLLSSPDEPDVPVYTTRAPEPVSGDLDPPLDEPHRNASPTPLAPTPGDDGVLDAHYSVHVVVDPAPAALWLDGERVASGELSILLARNGRTHELVILAPRHHPQTILFRDAPPPRAVRLEPVADDQRLDPESAPTRERHHSRAIPTVHTGARSAALDAVE